MDEIIYKRADADEIETIIKLQSDVFHIEQGIPEDLVEEFLSRNPICWCAKQNGEVIGTAIAWLEEGIMHWGRFVVVTPLRGKKIGPKLARYSFEDLFSMGVEVTGEPYAFYAGNVTPVVLKRGNHR